MRLLLDHCVNRRLAGHLTPHEVSTAAQLGWSALRNGVLLKTAASAGFEALVTTDANLRHEQNLAALPLAVIVLRAKTNLTPLVGSVLEALRGDIRNKLIEVGPT